MMNFVKRSMFRRGLSGVVVLVAIVGMGLYFWKGPGKATRFGQFLGSEPGHGRTEGETYYCPMHPSYKSDKPGNCPICSMKLVPLEVPAPSATAGAEATPNPPAPERSAPANQMIRISPERQQQIGVKFSEAIIRPATVEIRAVGRVAYDETRIAHVHTKVSGWIEDVFIDFIGEPVRKGQPLFTLYSPELVSAQEEYLLA